MFRRITTIALVVAVVGAPAIAEGHRDGLRHNYKHEYYQVVRDLGKQAAGRQIVSHGVRYCHNHKNGRQYCHRRGATKRDIAKSTRQLRKLQRPAPSYLVRTAVLPEQEPAQVRSPGVAAGSILNSIAQCESGGNPRAVSPDGLYRGKYQFDYGTWGSVGGTGDPAAAPEAEQDRRAAMLYAQRGRSPWPNC